MNREFLGRADFSGCTCKVAPEFHGTKIHEAIVFPSERYFLDTSSQRAPSAYRTLKLRMENARARNEEAMFFALEQRSRRSVPGMMSRMGRAASWAYDKSLRYGQSFGRALLWLGGAWLLFGVAFAIWESPPRSWCVCDWHGPVLGVLGHGLTFSLAQIANPFGIWRATEASLQCITSFTRWLQWAATAESIICAAFVALVILALRWQFKRE
jgi:hypothetical protein